MGTILNVRLPANINRAVTAALLCLSITFMPLATHAQDKFAAFRSSYVKELNEAGVVGSSFVFMKDGKIVAEVHLGSANLEKKQPVDADTIYHWASNTKPFTGIAIMQLRDRGLLKLDDPVTKYLPELREIHNRFGSMDEITIRHLLTHSGGFRGGTWPWRQGKDWEPFEPTKWSQLVAMFPFTEVLFKPGSKFSYSNPGIVYLGRTIEVITGEAYETYIEKNIFRPLGMSRSYFDTTPPHLLKHRSHSYYIRDGRRTEGRFDADTGITVSNSGLNAPVADMVKYLKFLIASSPVRTGSSSDRGLAVPQTFQSAERDRLESLSYETDSHRGMYETVLKRSSLEEMWRPNLPALVDANGNSGFTTDIGLIFFLNRRDARTFVGHGGDQNGFLSYIELEPATKQASIIVFNTNVIYPDGTPPAKNVVSRLRNHILALF
ncbi:MAG: beta-lactamase family protein [Chloracidobacterium sp.]|nr:beta-lactamase family protein [Chloracidobacterium sp.]